MFANLFAKVKKHGFHWDKPSGELFDLDLGVLVQNHGSIGASPMVAYFRWLKCYGLRLRKPRNDDPLK